MKSSFLLPFAALVHQAISTGYPTLPWDPDTAKDCIEWYNNSEGETCEEVRSSFKITPEQFHKWNPSLGLDCKPWNWQSYCIVTQERLDNFKPSTSSTSRVRTSTISTSTMSPLGPSPTAWKPLGCYAENSGIPVLKQKMSPASGDASLSIPKCKNSCYRQAYQFAGVQEGNQCWCSSFVAGEWTKNQTDCNTPCTGDKDTFCGGKSALNVFKALENNTPTATSIGPTSTSVKATITSAGAIRNRAFPAIGF